MYWSNLDFPHNCFQTHSRRQRNYPEHIVDLADTGYFVDTARSVGIVSFVHTGRG